jgi:hypothetical protein
MMTIPDSPPPGTALQEATPAPPPLAPPPSLPPANPPEQPYQWISPPVSSPDWGHRKRRRRHSGRDPENPYASPEGDPDTSTGVGATEWRWTKVAFEDVLGSMGQIFRRNLGPLYLGLFITMVLSQAVNWGLGLSLGVSPADPVNSNAPPEMKIIWGVVVVIFGAWITTGLKIYLLKIARGQHARIVDLFSGGRYLASVIAGSVLFYLMFAVGMVFCIVPGVVVGLMFCMFLYPIVDRGAGPVEALQLSQRMTEGNRLLLLGLYLIIFAIAIAIGFAVLFASTVNPLVGTGVSFVVGLLIQPFFQLLTPVCYLAMTGQSTADRQSFSRE